jgi:hypothetical protein
LILLDWTKVEAYPGEAIRQGSREGRKEFDLLLKAGEKKGEKI